MKSCIFCLMLGFGFSVSAQPAAAPPQTETGSSTVPPPTVAPATPATQAPVSTLSHGLNEPPPAAAQFHHPKFNNNAPPVVEMDGPPVSEANLQKAKKFCELIEACNKSRPGKAAYCVKTKLKESGLIDHVLGGDEAKELPRYLRREGFVDIELNIRDFKSVPEGSILVLDAHDPLKDKKPACPKVYGNVVVKCDDFWVDDQKNDLRFHLTRGCRTKGIWVRPELIPPKPVRRK